jgi:hypothetical protein
LIYNSVGSSGNQGGVLTRLDQETSKVKEGISLINEKSFDNNSTYVTPNGRGNQSSTLG